ncbi:ABC transporter substrate-binding protein [Colidextribacter sp. OB.20]|nr:ABC transporter substrate-binding protein [Colidextribacter sp. OB.20]
MNRILTLALSLAMTLSLAACGGNGTTTTQKPSIGNSGSGSAAQSGSGLPADGLLGDPGSDTIYHVGICNYVDDASLNQINENIQARLDEIGQEKNVAFQVDYDNPNADAAVMNQIIANFQADKVDLMVGIATPVAMAMQAATEDSDIPVVFSAVSDPVSAELVASLDAPGGNITGTSDYLDTNSVMNLIFAVNPDTKKIGLLYNVGQDSSATPIAHAKEYLDAKGIEYVERTGTNAAEVKQAAQALAADGVDAVFTPTDNTIMEHYLSIYEIFVDAGIPHYTGADSFALNGAFLGYGVDYANLGRETADMIAEILIDGKEPGALAVKTFDNGTATVNTETCEALGLDYDEIARIFAPLCTKVQPITTAEEFGDLQG